MLLGSTCSNTPMPSASFSILKLRGSESFDKQFDFGTRSVQFVFDSLLLLGNRVEYSKVSTCIRLGAVSLDIM